MHLSKSLAIVFCLIASSLRAQTIVMNSNLTLAADTSGGAQYRFTAYQNLTASDPTSIWFKYDGSKITFVNTNIDEGSDWYVVNPSDVFSAATIQAGMFTPIVTFNHFNFPPANVGAGDFYLGVNTGQGISPLGRTVFGWVHLRPTIPGFDFLTMVENAMSYNSPGIIVGTTMLVPEPGYVQLAIVAASALLILLRRR